MEYPKNHRQIVEELMSGKFILSTESIFEDLKSNEMFYSSFFKSSFNYELSLTNEYAYLISEETNENLSRDISIFFAILCYELDRDAKNFLDQLQYAEFTIEEVENYFENTSFVDLILSNKQLKDPDARRNLLNSMARRNIIEKTAEDRFVFTNAYKLFIDFAKDLAYSKTVFA